MGKTERRAPVQGVCTEWYRRSRGTVSWTEHEEAWHVYHQQPGCHAQDAEKIAQRGGFGYQEMTTLLGHEPTTWRPGR